MKTFKTAGAALLLSVLGLFAFRNMDTGSIKGTVVPPEGATRVWALSATDTLRANVQSGSFEITGVKAGVYRLIIEAKPPYKNTAKDNVTVADGQSTNVGQIRLGQ